MNIPTQITSLKEERILSIGNQNRIFINWNIKDHKLFPKQIKQEIRIILLMSLINSKTNKPNYKDSNWWKLPKIQPPPKELIGREPCKRNTLRSETMLLRDKLEVHTRKL